MGSRNGQCGEDDEVMDMIAVEIPKKLLDVAKISEQGASQGIRVLIAVHLFQRGVLTLGRAAELADVPVQKMMQALAEHRISLHYDVKDYREDLKTLEALQRR